MPCHCPDEHPYPQPSLLRSRGRTASGESQPLHRGSRRNLRHDRHRRDGSRRRCSPTIHLPALAVPLGLSLLRQASTPPPVLSSMGFSIRRISACVSEPFLSLYT